MHSIDFDVAVGERVAVVGPSGSGKSTLAAALVRFLPINGGYAVDGRDVTGHGTDVVRARVGLLTQQAQIFDTSLEENLRLAKPDATGDEINDVVRRVRLSEWVAALPRGLQQSMGEGGAAMSGGQRQRIGLARMLLADFDWQVLDEPTENLGSSDCGHIDGGRVCCVRRFWNGAHHPPDERRDALRPCRRRPGGLRCGRWSAVRGGGTIGVVCRRTRPRTARTSGVRSPRIYQQGLWFRWAAMCDISWRDGIGRA